MSFRLKILIAAVAALFLSSAIVYYLQYQLFQKESLSYQNDLRRTGEKIIFGALDSVAEEANLFLMTQTEDDALIEAFSQKKISDLKMVADGILRGVGGSYKYWLFGDFEKGVFAGVPELTFKKGVPENAKKHLSSSCHKAFLKKREEAGKCLEIYGNESIYWVYQPFYDDEGEVAGFTEIGISIIEALKTSAKSLKRGNLPERFPGKTHH